MTGGVVSPATAAPTSVPIDIPEATLDVAVIALARQARTEIVSLEPGLARVRSRAVHGQLPARVALDRLLAGTPYRAEAIAGGGLIVRRRAAEPHRPRQPLPTPWSPPMHEAKFPETVIVRASKQQVPLLRYPGTVSSFSSEGSAGLPATNRPRDLTDLGESIPVLQSTHLGPGRDKVFIRGVADSSFNGSTQSPTSLYWDDVQLNYTGPDPGLRLYDVSGVDVLEGPQGTLYGSGAIGGVVRVSSNPVSLSRAQGSFALGLTATQHGQPGGDASGMINLPLITDRLGVRAVAYGISDGGYLDDRQRGIDAINRTRTVGGRVALRLRPDTAWQVNVGGTYQSIHSRDGQYAMFRLGPFERGSTLAQPYSNRLLLGRLSVGRNWASGLQLLSATALVGYRSHDQFDASGLLGGRPLTYFADRRKRLLSEEFRLSRSLATGSSWVVGVSVLDNRDVLARAFGSPEAPFTITGVTNVTRSASAFVEGTTMLLPRLSATTGARLTVARVDGEPSSSPGVNVVVRGHPTTRVDPTLALSYALRHNMALFARAQSGFRTGGLAVAPGVGRVSDFATDTVQMAELGIRKLRSGHTGLTASSTLSATRWRKIQADLLTRRGTPVTVNLGDAHILAWEASAEWIARPGLTAAGSFMLSRNRVRGPMANLSQSRNRRLPETPLFSAHSELGYRWLQDHNRPSLGFTADYVGRSVLGTGDQFDIPQGRYLVLGAIAGIDWRGLHLSLAAENLGNVAANRFAFGNPFTLAARDQTTPLRPRNIRFGVATGW